MNTLTRKLLRSLVLRKGQFIAVVSVVAIGIMLYIAMSNSYQNLQKSQQDFYDKKDFADYYFQVVKAPERITKQIENLAGVDQVSGRITEDLALIKTDESRATARIVTYEPEDKEELNKLYMLTGRIFSSGSSGGEMEAVVDPQFMAANGLIPGDSISIVKDGRQINIRVVGSATGPEFIYVVKDAVTMFPDPEIFGIIMLPQRQVQQAFNMSGQINQILIKFDPGLDEERTIKEIEEILSPYGLLASYPRDDQISHAMVEAEIDGLKSIAGVLPVIFLLIAAAIQFVIIRRMIKTQRSQIGIMKALGYTSREIKSHYIIYSLLVGFCGALAGTILGILLSGYITDMFALYFNLPEKILGYNLPVIGNAFLLSIIIAAAAGWSAANAVTVIQPAESMRPETPKIGSHSILEKAAPIWSRLSPQWKMSLRSIRRNRGRFAVTLLGTVFAVILMIMALGTNDSVDYMMARHFDLDRTYDLQVSFAQPLKSSELLEISRLNGVERVEGYFDLPVKISYQGRSENELLTAYPLDMQLKQVFDTDNQTVQLPESGILINKNTAAKLGVQAGDEVTIETLLFQGPKHIEKVKIAGVNTQMFGGGSYLNLAAANRIIKEAGLVTGAMVKIRPGQEEQVEEDINEMLMVASLLNREKERENIMAMMESTIFVVGMMVLFALILGFAIIYNSSIISFHEREQEFAALKVIGFQSAEVSRIILQENLLQLILGLIIGLPAGGILTRVYLTSLSNELYDMPAAVYPLSYLLSALGVAVFVVLAYKIAVRGIDRLDLVEVLKNRD